MNLGPHGLSEPTRVALWTVAALALVAGLLLLGMALGGAPRRTELTEVQIEVQSVGALTTQRIGRWKTNPVTHGTAIVFIWDDRWPEELKSSVRLLSGSTMYLFVHDELPTDLVEQMKDQMLGSRRIAIYEGQAVAIADAQAPGREILSYADFEQAHRARALRRGFIGLACLLGAVIMAGGLRRSRHQALVRDDG